MKKNVLLGVSGGIAAYKALEIVSQLKKKDIEVNVIMTENATKFVTPLSFQSLSQNIVAVDTFSTIAVGSSSLPFPVVPQARRPSAGSTNSYP